MISYPKSYNIYSGKVANRRVSIKYDINSHISGRRVYLVTMKVKSCGADHRLRWVDLSGRVPEHREEVTTSARENKQVPDEVAVAQSLSREERHARRVRQPPSHEPR